MINHPRDLFTAINLIDFDWTWETFRPDEPQQLFSFKDISVIWNLVQIRHFFLRITQLFENFVRIPFLELRIPWPFWIISPFMSKMTMSSLNRKHRIQTLFQNNRDIQGYRIPKSEKIQNDNDILIIRPLGPSGGWQNKYLKRYF